MRRPDDKGFDDKPGGWKVGMGGCMPMELASVHVC